MFHLLVEEVVGSFGSLDCAFVGGHHDDLAILADLDARNIAPGSPHRFDGGG
jgi:hypothetical protein